MPSVKHCLEKKSLLRLSTGNIVQGQTVLKRTLTEKRKGRGVGGKEGWGAGCV